jgi:Cys-tRNA(Pro)/Cys-tRNA(Cys) deacylase
MAKKEPKKTNACRALDRLGFAYELKEYSYSPADLNAEKIAADVGLPPSQVFKTLCLRADDQDIVLAVVPADRELDLKAAAACAGKKSLKPVAVKELLGLTGYIRGGVTALACRKPYPVIADQSISRHSFVSVSAGKRGLQLWLAPADYLAATRATVGDLSR